MTVQYKMFGTLQYQLAGGAAADAWLAAWILDHQDDLREHEGNGQTFQPLIPPHAEGCLSQMVMEYHFETVDEAAFQALFDEVAGAIGPSGSVAQADCDYSLGSEYEA